jgi:glycosyltransferase involved in cell wall biosynthesis
MRIAIVNVTSGGLSGGYRKYLQQMVPRIAADPRIEAVHVFMPPSRQSPFFAPAAGSPSTFDVEILQRDRRWLHQRIEALRPDVVFVPTARAIECGNRPVVAMVRNMEPLCRPLAGNALPDKVRNVARAWTAWRAVRRASRVIAVSQFVRDFLVDRWRVRSAKVGMVYHGVEPAGTIEARRPALSIPPGVPLLFTAGSIRPARGLEDLIEATARLKQDGIAAALVIAGEPDRHTRFYRDRLIALADRLSVQTSLVWAGQLDDAAMAWCFDNADLFIMTSRAEACPNLALEAMSHGCIAVAGNHPPMPEIFGDAATYYPAGNSRQLTERIREGLEIGRGAAGVPELARRRAASFDWQDTARRTVDELVHAVAEHAR